MRRIPQRTIHNMFESDDEDMEERGGGGSGSESDAGLPSVVSPEKAQKAKGDDKGAADPTKDGEKKEKRGRRPPLQETDLVSALGFTRVLETFPKRVRYAGPGHEREYLRDLMCRYKEWAFDMYDGLAFEDAVEKIDKLAGKARVRDLISELRSKERTKFVAERFGEKAAKRVEQAGGARVIASKAALPSSKGNPGYNRYGNGKDNAPLPAGAAVNAPADAGYDSDLEVLPASRSGIARGSVRAGAEAATEALGAGEGKKAGEAENESGRGFHGEAGAAGNASEMDVMERIERSKQLALERLHQKRSADDSVSASAASLDQNSGRDTHNAISLDFDEFDNGEEDALFAAAAEMEATAQANSQQVSVAAHGSQGIGGSVSGGSGGGGGGGVSAQGSNRAAPAFEGDRTAAAAAAATASATASATGSTKDDEMEVIPVPEENEQSETGKDKTTSNSSSGGSGGGSGGVLTGGSTGSSGGGSNSRGGRSAVPFNPYAVSLGRNFASAAQPRPTVA